MATATAGITGLTTPILATIGRITRGSFLCPGLITIGGVFIDPLTMTAGAGGTATAGITGLTMAAGTEVMATAGAGATGNINLRAALERARRSGDTPGGGFLCLAVREAVRRPLNRHCPDWELAGAL